MLNLKDKVHLNGLRYIMLRQMVMPNWLNILLSTVQMLTKPQAKALLHLFLAKLGEYDEVIKILKNAGAKEQ